MRLSDCQEVAEAADLQTLESRMMNVANDLGFGIISGFLVVEHSESDARVLYIGRTAEEYQCYFESKALGKRDPVMRRLKRVSAPFTYDQATYINEGAGDLWEVQARYGYKTGIAMSLHLPERQHFALGVDREQALPRDEVMLARLMADFHLLAAHARIAAQRLLAPAMGSKSARASLTMREIEILKWTDEGKSAWAVGRILSISEHTVNFHVQKLLTKLAVSSKYQAAAKARSLGLI